MTLYYRDLQKDISLLLGDAFEIMKTFEDGSFDQILTDPPYFLSNDGVTCYSGQMVSVNKGEWDKSKVLTMDEFNLAFLRESMRLLKPTGTIWVSGTMHNIYSIGYYMQQLNYRILNNITWQKTNPPPNLGCRMFTHSTETILWASKGKKARHNFNYDLMKMENNGKQMKDVWTSSATKKSEKEFGKHPTQKPLWLIERMILSSTNETDLILDPFIGSGTTAVVGAKFNRRVIGIDSNEDYLDIARKRLESVKEI